MDFKVKCKRCGRMAKPEEYVLDNVYRMMVCPACVKERKTEEQAELKAQPRAEEKKKPVGWDAEDEYLEKAHREKMSRTVAVEKVDSERVKYRCLRCKYEFLFNIVRRTPANCPYCGEQIHRMRL